MEPEDIKSEKEEAFEEFRNDNKEIKNQLKLIIDQQTKMRSEPTSIIQ